MATAREYLQSIIAQAAILSNMSEEELDPYKPELQEVDNLLTNVLDED